MSTDHRTPCPCVRVNAASGPFGGEGGLRPPSQILALCIYDMPTVSTISRPRLLGADSVYRLQNTMPVCAGERCQRAVWWGRGPSAPLILALRVYNMPTVSAISRPRLLGADSVYRPQNTMPVCAGERCQRAVRWGRGPNIPQYWHFASTTCPRCLQLAGRVYLGQTVSTDCRTPCPCARVNAASGPFGGEGGLRPPSLILALRVYNMPTVSTISRPRLLGAGSVYRLQNTMPVCAGERCQRTVWWGGGPSAPFPNIGTSRLRHAHGVYN